MPDVDSESGGNHRVQYGVAWTIGYRDSMEDAHFVDVNLDDSTSLFAVFDGHGGSEVARFCARNVREALTRSSAYVSRGDLGEALREALLLLDEEVCKRLSHHTGATATLVALRQDELVVAGVGDSRCVLARRGKPLVLTTDHKPSDEKEEARIRSAGGFVIFGRVNATLNISRALGDAAFKGNVALLPTQQQISPEAEVQHAQLHPLDDTFLVLACDGVWNSLHEQKVVDFVAARLAAGDTAAAAAAALCHECNRPTCSACDNVTAVVVVFKDCRGGSGCSGAGSGVVR